MMRSPTDRDTSEGSAVPVTGRGDDRSSDSSPADNVSLIQIGNMLLRQRWVVVALPLLLAILVVGWTLIGQRSYTSTAAFMPQQGEQQLSGVSGLATQFGIEIPTEGAGQSPQFYRELVVNSEFLRRLAASEFVFPESVGGGEDGGATNLSELMRVEGETAARRVERTVRRLRQEVVNASLSLETGVVEVSATTISPSLSRQIAERILDLVNEFNVERRQSQAAERRQFVEGRLATARSELEVAEDSLEQFLQRNRGFEESPTLGFRHNRLQRQVDIKDKVVASLAQSLEEARIDEVRNTPVITVVEEPVEAAFPDSRFLKLRLVLALAIGGLLALAWTLGYEFVRRSKVQEEDEYEEFRRLTAEARSELRGFVDWIP